MAYYACADFHGYYKAYEKVKQKLNPKDKVVYLGDAVDRGPDGFKLLKTILNDPQFIFLKGNHEDMFTDAAMLYLKDKYILTQFPLDINLERYFNNGGETTFLAWVKEGANIDIIQEVNELPYSFTYLNASGKVIFLNHSGYIPFNRCHYIPEDEGKCLWDRNCVSNDYPNLPADTAVLVHGHTPVQTIIGAENTVPYIYGNNNKYDIDIGTTWTKKVCLINLDTFDWEIL